MMTVLSSDLKRDYVAKKRNIFRQEEEAVFSSFYLESSKTWGLTKTLDPKGI